MLCFLLCSLFLGFFFPNKNVVFSNGDFCLNNPGVKKGISRDILKIKHEQPFQ